MEIEGEPFASIWDERQKVRAVMLLANVYRELESRQVRPFIGFGTLLGACRNGRLIPWDDDFDLCVEIKHKPVCLETWGDMGLRAVEHGSHDVKVFSKNGKETKYHFRRPWVDIIFYRVLQGEVFFYDNVGVPYYHAPYEDTFPLVPKTFEGLSLMAPCNAEKHLDIRYPNWRKKRSTVAVVTDDWKD